MCDHSSVIKRTISLDEQIALKKKGGDSSIYSPVVLTPRINKSQATMRRMTPMRPM
jgi:hypothetical protein